MPVGNRLSSPSSAARCANARRIAVWWLALLLAQRFRFPSPVSTEHLLLDLRWDSASLRFSVRGRELRSDADFFTAFCLC